MFPPGARGGHGAGPCRNAPAGGLSRGPRPTGPSFKGEGFAYDPPHRRPSSVGRSAQPREAHVFPTAFEQSTLVVDLASAIEIQRRVRRERPDTDDGLVVDRVPNDLPQRALRAWRLALVRDLFRLWRESLHRATRRLHGRPH